MRRRETSGKPEPKHQLEKLPTRKEMQATNPKYKVTFRDGVTSLFNKKKK
jgi:hypothetical protein